MTNDTTRAQRDVEQARAQIGETVEELKRRLSPGELFDEVKSQLMSGGGSQRLSQTASRFTQQVQENPLAVMLIGGGLAWLMMGSRDHHGHTGGDGSGTLSAARERVASGAHGVASGAHGVAERTSHMVESGTEHAGETVRHMRETSSEMIERYPLAAGAAAVALGVILGAALPATSVEDRQIGETADKLKETATERGQEALSEARDVAAKAGETAASEAEKRGLVQPEGSDRASTSPGRTGRG